MLCLICRQAELIDEFMSVIFERGEQRINLNNVPAGICPNCGDAVVGQDIAAQMLKDVDEILKTGEHESAHDFLAG
jgi:YgiT-type zinc finger domain-containing protein